MRKPLYCLVALLTLATWQLPPADGRAAGAGQGGKTAIVLASFGTTEPSAVEAILNIWNRVQTAYPGVPVKITFTSNIIRGVWKQRRAEAERWMALGIPRDVLNVKNIIATFGELQEEGFSDIVVQPTHMFFMEQSHDLLQYVNAMRSIRTIKDRWRPFDRIALGRPALGTVGDRYDYRQDLERAAKALAQDAARARKEKAQLVYMGHGNDHWPTSIYVESAEKMRELYPDVSVHIGVVEGYPGIEQLLPQLPFAGSKKILLKPYMIVAGNHAKIDMAGDGPDSWRSILEARGYAVEAVMEGLGSNDAFADIFVSHIRDAARDAGISLAGPTD